MVKTESIFHIADTRWIFITHKLLQCLFIVSIIVISIVNQSISIHNLLIISFLLVLIAVILYTYRCCRFSNKFKYIIIKNSIHFPLNLALDYSLLLIAAYYQILHSSMLTFLVFLFSIYYTQYLPAIDELLPYIRKPAKIFFILPVFIISILNYYFIKLISDETNLPNYYYFYFFVIIIMLSYQFYKYQIVKLKAKYLEKIKEYVSTIRDAKLTKRELETANEKQQLYSSVIHEMIRASRYIDTEENFNKNLENVSKILCSAIRAEFFSIGLCEDEYVRDLAPWLPYELTQQQLAALDTIKSGPLEGSLIGSVVSKLQREFVWNGREQGNILTVDIEHEETRLDINIDFANKYTEAILNSKKIVDVIIVPLFSPRNPNAVIGFIHAVNKLKSECLEIERNNGFTDDDMQLLRGITPQLSIIIENYIVIDNSLNISEDERFLNGIMFEKNTQNALNQILCKMNEIAKTNLASLWLATEDGYESEENARLILVSYDINTDKIKEPTNLLKMLSSVKLLHSQNSYLFDYFNSSMYESTFYFNDPLELEHHLNKQSLIDFQLFNEMCFPIYRNINNRQYDQEFAVVGKTTNNKEIIGVLCLGGNVKKVELSTKVMSRLNKFANHLATDLERILFKRLMSQFDNLRDGLENINFTVITQFYKELADIISNVVGTESCSIFLFNEITKNLELKASSSHKAIFIGKDSRPANIRIESLIDKPIYNISENYDTVNIFRDNKSAVIHNFDHESEKFVEMTEHIPNSLIVSIIHDSKGDKIGLIRCINKRIDEAALPLFIKWNKYFLDLVKGIVSKLIENIEVNKEKDDFVRKMIHEVSIPLNAIIQQIEFIKQIFFYWLRVKDPVEQFKYLETEGERLKHLISDLDYKLLKGKYKFNYRMNSNVRELLEKVKKLLISDARKGKNINIKTYTNKMPNLCVDISRLEQVFFNIIQNAIKYSDISANNIEVSYEREIKQFTNCDNSEWHVIYVKNWGLGVLETEKDSIFDEYKRGSNASSREVTGTGIGLFLSNEIIKRHDGYIEVRKLNKPTIFAIYLPTYLEEKRPNYENTINR